MKPLTEGNTRGIQKGETRPPGTPNIRPTGPPPAPRPLGETPPQAREQEILNLLKNKEVVVTGGPGEQYKDYESRYYLKISGPERLVKKLAGILWEVE